MDWTCEFSERVALRTRPTSAGSFIIETLRPARGAYYVLKPKHSAFLCSALPAILSNLEIRQLVVTGMATDSCVLMTARLHEAIRSVGS